MANAPEIAMEVEREPEEGKREIELGTGKDTRRREDVETAMLEGMVQAVEGQGQPTGGGMANQCARLNWK